MMSHEISCNLCGQSRFKILEEDQVPFKVLKCQNCSLVFVYPQSELGELKDHYDEAYYSEWINAEQEKRRKMWYKRLTRLEKHRDKGMLLDVGCGEGSFLKEAQGRGWQVRGTELSSYSARYASNVLGMDIFCGELKDAKYPDHSFDVVTMWHVLEHVTDPNTYLSEIYRILKPHGLLAMAVPNVNNLVMQLAYRIFKGRKLKYYCKHEREVHLYHFSPATIKIYLEKAGFECLRISPDYGIIDLPKKFTNMIAVIPYYLAGIKVFNALEIFAIAKKSELIGIER